MCPATCIGTIAFVFFVIALLIESGSILKSSKTSTNTGFAPVAAIAFVVIIQVYGVVITSSPRPIPRLTKARYKALLPEPTPTANFAPISLANLSSNFFNSGPSTILP